MFTFCLLFYLLSLYIFLCSSLSSLSISPLLLFQSPYHFLSLSISFFIFPKPSFTFISPSLWAASLSISSSFILLFFIVHFLSLMSSFCLLFLRSSLSSYILSHSLSQSFPSLPFFVVPFILLLFLLLSINFFSSLLFFLCLSVIFLILLSFSPFSFPVFFCYFHPSFFIFFKMFIFIAFPSYFLFTFFLPYYFIFISPFSCVYCVSLLSLLEMSYWSF
jgi:hypothetical protein